MGARWFYSGDVNCQHGGFWYRLDNMQHGYADCWRITPCSDAGGPDNQFWLESLTVNIPDDDKLAQAMDSCGWLSSGAYDAATKAQRKHMAIDACVAYGYYDQNSSEVIQIGAKPDSHSAGFDPVTPDTVLRAGSSLRNYVRRAHLRNA